MSDGETSIYTRSSYREADSIQHGALEYGSDLHVNERQNTRHYRARSTEEERRMKTRFFYFTLCACKLHYCDDVIHSFDWKSAVEHDGGV